MNNLAIMNNFALAKMFTMYYQWLTPSLAPRPLWPHTHFGSKRTSARGTFWPEEYFNPNNTSAQCLLWLGNTLVWGTFQPKKYSVQCLLWPRNTLAQYTSARGPHFQSPICRCCCMLHNSRLENVPWLKMLFYKG